MSAVDHYLTKNYGQYVLVLESELANSCLTISQQCVLYSNIALAQLRKYSTVILHMYTELLTHILFMLLIRAWAK